MRLLLLFYLYDQGKHHQHNNPATSTGQDQNPVPQQPAPVVVSNSNEVRIESVMAHQHTGYYECMARNSDDESTFSRLGIDLEVECEYQLCCI